MTDGTRISAIYSGLASNNGTIPVLVALGEGQVLPVPTCDLLNTSLDTSSLVEFILEETGLLDPEEMQKTCSIMS